MSSPLQQWDAFHLTTYALAIVFLVIWAVHWLFHIIAILMGKLRLYRRKELSVSAEKGLPGVSILKPLTSGNDANLFQNLETFFTLNYPKYELLFCIQDVEDSRLRMYVDSLRTKFPAVDCQVFYGGEDVGVNPKINNMQPAYEAAKYDLIMVSDMGIRMREDTLSDMVSCMGDKVGLVHQMPFACDRTGWPATLEKVYFGTYHARMYLSANFFGINCATGMSSLMRKAVLDEEGGMKAFAGYLAEDYFFAKTFLRKGYQIDISSLPALQNPSDASVGMFQSRITRWTKLRVAMLPHLLLFEPLSECMLLGALAAWAAFYLLRWDPLSFFLVHVLAWFLMDWIMIHIVQNGDLPFNRFEFAVMWLFRELSAPYLFLAAQWNPHIRWRTNEFRLRWGGIAEVIEGKIKL